MRVNLNSSIDTIPHTYGIRSSIMGFTMGSIYKNFFDGKLEGARTFLLLLNHYILLALLWASEILSYFTSCMLAIFIIFFN